MNASVQIQIVVYGMFNTKTKVPVDAKTNYVTTGVQMDMMRVMRFFGN